MNYYPDLHHYSDSILEKVVSKDIRKRGATFYKPNGLWVSVDEIDGDVWGWPAWCDAEDYSVGSIKHLVSIVNPKRILWITTESDLVWFNKVFGMIGGGYYGRKIDWPLVAEQFAGIVIAPFQNGYHLDMDWYYGWDCASGVIWDASIVSGIEVVE